MAQLTLEEWLARLEKNHRFWENVQAFQRLPEKKAVYADFPVWVHEKIRKALKERGIERLYSHQARAIEAVRSGKDICLVTPTASGKTLCYNIPTLQKILEDSSGRALYLFPTKALAQDQLHELEELIAAIGGGIKTFTYDGDTPDEARQAIRRQGHIIITNPDMLHTGILPHHTKWQKLFADLKYVVIDELHIYRGVFGSHVANVLRRLKRICQFYGAEPVFVCCSATIANPREHAERMLERAVEVIDESGAPQAEKLFIFYNPPVVNRELGIRQSPLIPARRLACDLIENGIQTIIFTTSRLTVEVLTKYIKDKINEKKPTDDRIVTGYRGGYLPQLRREIEKGLRSGEIKGVVATTALELGIDIGELSACLICGYPGSIAGTWQQAGRAGRRSGKSIAILIARSLPMDQFLMENPDYFFSRSPEHCRINPDNLLIYVQHVKSAAFELPFEKGEKFGTVDPEEVLSYLTEEGVLHKVKDTWHWSAESYPANEVSLRSVSPENVVIIDVSTAGRERIIAEVDWDSAFRTVHEGAIYMVESEQYEVIKLNLEGRKAYVKKVSTDYYTDAMTYTNVKVLSSLASAPRGGALWEFGELGVTSMVVGYKKIRFYTGENVGYGEVHLPEKNMHTTGAWITIPRKLLLRLNYPMEDIVDGLMGLAYGLHHLSALYVMADIHDLDHSVGNGLEVGLSKKQGDYVDFFDRFDPIIFIFDAYPGGVGFAELIYERRGELIAAARRLLQECPCKFGCPSCVGPTLEVGKKAKEVARAIIELVEG
ncbi:MAG TPA: DEAD/DEAH box helicase [Syntrophales bacterium]|nr:DEAD/DEAH box helicase [Syntrophales bacterium]HOL59116.1 DEAD/DEAH box helicase [Syntrophales bacterium]HPO35374.1 DEAD/DEAH box helicase [Syntrophales bacterium]